MAYRHYHQSDISIKSETENVKYKRYIENEQKRFLQFIEGTLTEILPSDFSENITTLRSYAISSFENISYIELPDTITKIETNAIAKLDSETGVTTIVFPENLTRMGKIFDSNDSEASIIMDFSKAKTVPTAIETDSMGYGDLGGFYTVTEIRVPQTLYNTWIKTDGWNLTTIKEKIVAV